jgi:hypothetical protein
MTVLVFPAAFALAAPCLAQPWPKTSVPQDAVAVQTVGVPGSALLERALLTAERAAARGWPAETPLVEFLRQRGALAGDQRLLPERTVVLQSDRLLLPAYWVGRRALRPPVGRQANALSFRYVGWTASEQATLQDYVARAYPVLVSVYGPPAASIQVSIVKDTNLHNLLGGTYNASTNEIRMPAIADASRDTYTLANLILRAFHDDLMLFYEAWEAGFCRAAALAAHKQVDPSFSASDDPFYFLPLYELLNKPALGNSKFFPPSGFTGMSVWRIGMAQAAWLKVMGHYPNFFRDFNALYYAQWTPTRNPPLSGDVEALVQIAATVAPTVESMPFADWFRRQHVLDTSVAIGEKLYAAPYPLHETVALELDYYRTLSTGDEQPFSGTGHLSYSGWDGVPYFPYEGSEVPISAGQGFLSPTFANVGGPQRISIEASVGQQQALAYFPYAVSGPQNENEFFGITVGADSGTVSLVLADGRTGMPTVSQGAWSLDAGASLNKVGTSVFDYKTGGRPGQKRRAGTAWLYYVGVLQSAPGSATSLTHTFPAGLNLVTFPIEPFETDAARVLGLQPLQTLLARWKPDLSGTNKYVFYPHTPPIAPGLGYWLKLDQARAVTITGVLASSAAPYPIRLLAGWNQVGNPFAQTVPLGKITVKYLDRAPVTFSTAVTQELVSAIYRLGADGKYQASQELPPWEAVWVQAKPADGVWLLVSPP